MKRSSEETRDACQIIEKTLVSISALESALAAGDWEKMTKLLSSSPIIDLDKAYDILVRSAVLTKEDKVIVIL